MKIHRRNSKKGTDIERVTNKIIVTAILVHRKKGHNTHEAIWYGRTVKQQQAKHREIQTHQNKLISPVNTPSLPYFRI